MDAAFHWEGGWAIGFLLSSRPTFIAMIHSSKKHLNTNKWIGILFCQQINKVLNTSCTPVLYNQSLTLPCQPVFIPRSAVPGVAAYLHIHVCGPCFKYHGTGAVIPLTCVHNYRNTLCYADTSIYFPTQRKWRVTQRGTKLWELGVFGSTYINEWIIKSCVWFISILFILIKC